MSTEEKKKFEETNNGNIQNDNQSKFKNKLVDF